MLKMDSEQKPISFFGLKGFKSHGDGNFALGASKEFYWAEAHGSRADELKEDMSRFHDISEENKQTVTHENDACVPSARKDYLAEPALLTTVALLDTYKGPNAVIAGNKTFQLNYVEIEPPAPGATIWTLNKERIFIPKALCRDGTGSKEIGMREKAVFGLARLDGKDPCSRDKFAEMVEKGHLQFPLLSSLCVAVDLKEPRAENESQRQSQASEGQVVGDKKVRLTIVEAVEQGLTRTPNAALISLFDFVSECEDRQDVLTPAELFSIRGSVHHPLMVNTEGASMPCAKALAFILATERSTQSEIFDGALRVPNENVLCALGDKAITYTLTTLCHKDKLSEAVIAPPRSGSRQQAAMVTITGMLGPTEFLLEGVQPVGADELPAVYHLFRKLFTVSKNESAGTEKRPLWDDQHKTVSEAKKCKMLSASPSDASLPGTE